MASLSRILLFVCLFLFSVFFLPFVHAKYITLSNDFSLRSLSSGFFVTITSTNSGDETAYDVVHEIFALNGSLLGKTHEKNIPPSERKEFSLHFAGQPPFVVRTIYHDANYYPFSFLSYLPHRTPPLSSLQITSPSSVVFLEKTRFSLILHSLLNGSSHLSYTVFVPKEMKVMPSHGSFSLNKKEILSFTLQNNGMLAGNQNTLLVIFTNGTHYASKTLIVKRYQGSLIGKLGFFVREYPFQLFFVVGVFLFFILLVVKKFPQHWFSFLSFLLLYGFLFSYFSPSLLFSSTITTGGDTASHYYTLQFLHDHLSSFFPTLSSWTMGNYAGFPLLHYYFILPFFGMLLLSIFVGLPIAFKIGTLFGTFLLPLAVYYFFKKMRFPFPWPLVASYSSLFFLFNTGNSMWGGNIPSTLAGEFSYSLSFALFWFFLGSMIHALHLFHQKQKFGFQNFFLPVLLLFLLGLSHVYTLLVAYALFPFFFVLGFTKKHWSKVLVWLIQCYGTATFLLGLFYIPLYARLSYTTPYADFWHISIKQVFPQIFWFLFGLGIFGFLGLTVLQRKKLFAIFSFSGLLFSSSSKHFSYHARQGIMLLVSVLVLSFVFFFSAVFLGVVNIRFIPFLQLALVLMSVFLFGFFCLEFWKRYHHKSWFLFLKKSWMQKLLVFFFLLTLLSWVSAHESYIPHWIKWNYEGFEQKQPWPLYKEINDDLFVPSMMHAPRVVFEHNTAHNIFGTIRAFESLPLFANRATLEGLYMQSSLNAPFIFYMQSLYSVQQSCPFPHFGCAHTNLSLAYPYFQLYHVGQEIVVTPTVAQAMDALPYYHQWKSYVAYGKHYFLYNITLTNTSYILVPRYKPVVLPFAYNQKLAFLWFLHPEQLAVPLLFSEKPLKGDAFLQAPPSVLENTSSLVSFVQHLPHEPLDEASSCYIRNVSIDHFHIAFTTSCPHIPHLVKISFFPNWQSKDADLYHVAPSFMMVVPRTSSVTISWKMTFVDWLGVMSFMLGILFLLLSKNIYQFLQDFFTSRVHLLSFWILLFLVLFLFLGVLYSLHHHFGFQQDALQRAVAIATRSWRACDYAGNERDDCLIDVGSLTDDYNLCFVEVSKKKKNSCYFRIATAFHDRNLCGYITDEMLKQKCFSLVSR